MSSEWTTHKLEDLFELVNGFAFKGSEFKSSGVPVLKIKNVKPNNIALDNLAYVDEAVALKRPEKEVKRGDILITMSGNRMDGSKETWVGKVAYFNLHGQYMLNQRVGILRPRPGVRIDRKCCAYFLSSDEYQHFFISIATSSGGQANLSPAQILGEKIQLPPLEEQKQIAALVGALDDRIALLRETNATLEAIAQAMFKSWFVDFDPVHANAKGRAPEGMSETIPARGTPVCAPGVPPDPSAAAALFPDSFEESELGLVPRGWKISTLGECTSYLNRGISPKYIEDGGVVVINQKCIRDFIVDLSKARRHDPTQRKIDGRELCVGDVLVNSTGVGTLGRVAQILTLDEPTIIDSHVTAVRASGNLSWNYLGLALMRKQPEIEGYGEGTTGQTELSRGKLANIKMVIPSKSILDQFDEIIVPLRNRFAENLQQAQTLATLRDTLLPRLISGQLRLPDVQIDKVKIEEVA